MTAIALPAATRSASPLWGRFRASLRRHPTAIAGGVVLLLMVLIAVLAPWLGSVDPQAVAPLKRMKPPSADYWFGSDMLGRDVYSRVLFGARVSLLVGIAVAFFSTLLGLAIGLVTGFVRWLDAIVMRVMDGLMSIPPVLLAIAIAIMVKMGWPPVFAQERPGLQGRLFRIYKFRTMTAARDAEGALLPDEQRLTRRASRIDRGVGDRDRDKVDDR